MFATVGVVAAPSAAADANDTLREAVATARGTACGPLRYDPAVAKAADEVNTTVNNYTDHNARFIPEGNALPIAKDLGYRGSRASILSAAAKTDASAIKGVLLQGYLKIPDCSYTDFGVSTQYNQSKGMTLLTVVLAS